MIAAITTAAATVTVRMMQTMNIAIVMIVWAKSITSSIVTH